MAEVKFGKGSEEWMMFTEFWQLCQKYWNPENNDSYWDGLVTDVDAFYKKFSQIELSKELALSFIRSQEIKFEKGERSNGEK